VAGHPLVFPAELSRAFTETRQFACRVNEYHDGTTQRMALVSSSRRSWKCTRRLAPAEMAVLRAFLLAHPTDAFYFYSPKETSPLFTADPTGAATSGRYKVRLNGDINETIYIPRAEVEIELVEVA
jgi:phage-related protein